MSKLVKIYSGDLSLLNKIIVDDVEYDPVAEMELEEGSHIIKYQFISDTEIPKDAFNDCDELKTISIPEGYTTLSENAFYNCNNLKNVVLPTTIATVAANVFYDCDSLTDIDVPVTAKVDEHAFDECAAKDNLFIGENEYNTIYYTTTDDTILELSNLAVFGSKIMSHTYENGQGKIICKNNIFSIGNSAFEYQAKLKTIVLPNTITIICEKAFNYCQKLESVNFPNSLKTIENNGFQCCYNLGEINLPSSVEYLGGYVFNICNNVKTITINNYINNFEDFNFANCKNLDSIYIYDINFWCNLNFGENSWFGNSNPLSLGKHLYLNNEQVINLIIPDSVTSIGNYSFYNLADLISVSISDSVTSIGNFAFYNTNLESFTITKLVNYTSYIYNDYNFEINNKYTIKLGDSILPSNIKSIIINYNGNELLKEDIIKESISNFKNEILESFNYNNFKELNKNLIIITNTSWLPTTISNPDFKIYVPLDLLDDYKESEAWADYVDYIYPITSDNVEGEFTVE